MALCRLRLGADDSAQWGWMSGALVTPLPDADVMAVLAGGVPRGLSALGDSARASSEYGVSVESLDRGLINGPRLLAPVTSDQEVWAAGVTYESSKFARMGESEHAADLYAKVYVAERPELFFKATASRTVGTHGTVRIRDDSRWNVPEPELAALIAADGTILGYTLGNDMSSRDIEGENALYLPQAKLYRNCCGLGPVVAPASEIDPGNLELTLTIQRNGEIVFGETTSTARMKRTVADIASWLFRENDFPGGVYLLTGTGIIPPESFTLARGDLISIAAPGLGVLYNTVG